MTKSELIVLIGDVLTDLDVLRGSLNPNLPSRKRLDSVRQELDASQRQLTNLVFKENTAQFVAITNQIKGLNEQLQKVVSNLDEIVATINLAVELTKKVEEIFLTAVSLMA